MLSGAVKRLRTTNQLKEGMERVIIDQCMFILFYFNLNQHVKKIRYVTLYLFPCAVSLTHGVLKKARGNLEVSLPA